VEIVQGNKEARRSVQTAGFKRPKQECLAALRQLQVGGEMAGGFALRLTAQKQFEREAPPPAKING
jgi:hypothetical protein